MSEYVHDNMSDNLSEIMSDSRNIRQTICHGGDH